MRTPEDLETEPCFLVADAVARLDKPQTLTGLLPDGQCTPIAPARPQQVIAETTEQHIIWNGFLGMKLEAIALEVLREKTTLGGLLLLSSAEWIAEHGKAAVLLPVLAEASADAI